MTRSMLMATTALVAMHAINATAAPAPKSRTLYTQNSNQNGSIGAVSQNFTSGVNTTYDNWGADDFIIPAGEGWKIGRVDVTGIYFNGSGPAKSVNVVFWKDNRGEPGNTVARGAYNDLACSDRSGSFSCRLPKKLRLKPGHYWVTVQANCGFYTCGEWSWDLTSVIHNDPAEWEEYNSFNSPCPTWGTLEVCFGNAAWNGDLMFDLKS